MKLDSGELCSCVQSILDKGAPYFEEKIKPEMLQSTVEYISDVLPDLTSARKELYSAHVLLSRLAREEGLALASAGTHPSASWLNQERTEHERYEELEEEYQDIGRSILIFGLHVHVAVADKELQIKIMNQARAWLPHLLALSSNSPFWQGRMTGIKSYRAVVWKRFPRSGMPAFFDTLEFRICDMPSTLDDPRGTGADRQIALYQESNDLQKVNKFLIERTMEGVESGASSPTGKPLRFRSRKLASKAGAT